MNILHLLERSRAAEPFRAAVARFLHDGQPNEHIDFQRENPPIKVERTLAQILESYPELPIERVEIDATSGCSSFRGSAAIHLPEDRRRISFDWDCRWRAELEGWTDFFGFPDQARAAREFGHRCFRLWTEDSAAYSS